jgi:hypothetical protein
MPEVKTKQGFQTPACLLLVVNNRVDEKTSAFYLISHRRSRIGERGGVAQDFDSFIEVLLCVNMLCSLQPF